VRDHTPYDIAVRHVLETRGLGARADMDAALQAVAEELETFALKRDRIVTVGGTVGFVVFGLFLAQEVSAKVEGVALVAPPLANMMLAIALVAAFAAFAASRKKDHLIELEKRGKSLSTIRDPALAPGLSSSRSRPFPLEPAAPVFRLLTL
jgi:hypothetical protein